ncbi:sigma-70 family RNA polymerase sigma factor [Thermopolyspora sp. NPDC052614]|uniref:sigma-70 family RNA polymerase sigma factor n=1 Tax=Thermopolyspora sp. NPDC052614 TaxID=3155682 RepID=UPI00342BDF56
MTVDMPSVRPGEPGLRRAMARVLEQLRSSAVDGAVPFGAFEVAAEQMRLTPEACERFIAALADLGLRVATPKSAATVAQPDRSERALALVRRHIRTDHVTRVQLERFGALAGLDAEEIASLPNRARKAGIAVLSEEPASARQEPVITTGCGPEPTPREPTGPIPDLHHAVVAARRLISGDRFRANPGKRLLSAIEEVGLSVLLRGGVDRADVEPTDEELAALPANDLRRIARDTFVLHNTRLVYSLASNYLGQGLEEADLVQHGILGLIRATRKFDPYSGNKFSTYATWWIRQAITRAIADEGTAIRIPVHMYEKMRKVAGTESALRRAGKPATAVDVAFASGLGVREVDEVRALSRVTDSLDRIIGDGAHLGDFLSWSTPTPSPEEILEGMFSREVVKQWLAPLSDKAADILRRRFGLDGDEPQTLEQIGNHYGVTRERIRQLEAKALEQIREQLPEELSNRLPAHLRTDPKERAPKARKNAGRPR